jgi:hypothetical protein
MYPAHVFSLYPPFARDKRAFVAMSFDPVLGRRWSEVIAPAITDCGVEPCRVDASKISDSILTDILKAISNAKLIVADVSVIGGVRNANVMYEVGLAHAVREPHEVILFRSDEQPLLFDIATVRVNRYDPDGNPEQAKETIPAAITDALAEHQLQRSMTVERTASMIDAVSLEVMISAGDKEGLTHPALRTPEEVIEDSAVVQAIPRLIELGVIESTFPKSEGPINGDAPFREMVRDRIRYRSTFFGDLVMAVVLHRVLTGHKGVHV